MEKIKQIVQSLYGYSGQTVTFIGSNLGLRMPSAPPLPPEEVSTLQRALRALVMAALLIGAAYGGLLYSVTTTVDGLLASEVPGSDIEDLWSRWSWQFYGSLGLFAVSLAVFIWALSLFKRFRIHIIFLFAALLLCAGTLAWRPCARIVVTGKMLSLFSKGLNLWEEKQWKPCYRYYARLYAAFPKSFIADNCLGRMAGCEFRSGNYENALQHYATLLQRFPASDIRENVATSVRWTMRELWNKQKERDVTKCINIYREASLAERGFSVYEYFMTGPVAGEAAQPARFGSFSYKKREEALELMKAFPTDKWTARIAFFCGEGEILKKRFPDSRYNAASGVVEGWRLHSIQDFAQAAQRYVAFLATQPPEEEQIPVRRLLSLCYLASQDLEEAIANLQAAATTKHSIPETEHHRFLARFAFLESEQRMKELFDRIKTRLPVAMAADMAAILAERLELMEVAEGASVAEYRSMARRLPELAKGSNISGGSSGRIAADLLKLRPTSNLVTYANARFKQTDRDNSYQHLLDRHYGEQRELWPEAQRVSYTRLLQGRLQRGFTEQIAIRTNLTSKLKFAAETLENLKDAGCLHEIAARVIAEVDSKQTVLDATQLVFVRRMARVTGDQHLDSIGVRALQGCFASDAGRATNSIHDAFLLADFLPRDAVLMELARQLSQAPRGTTNARELISTARIMETELRRSDRRTLMAHDIVPIVADCYRRAHEAAPSATSEQALLKLGEYCLQGPTTYDLARRLFDEYKTRFPKSDYVANCRLWLAWLCCYDANRHRDVPSAYETHYRRALTYYTELAGGTRQEKLEIIGRHAARKIRRKLGDLATGSQKPTDYRIPNEITQFALPSALLESAEWRVHTVSSTGVRRESALRFEHGTLKADLFGHEARVPFHLTVRGGKESFHAKFPVDKEEQFVITGDFIKGHLLSGKILRVQRNGRIMEVSRIIGADDEPTDKVRPPAVAVTPVSTPPKLRLSSGAR